MRVLQINKFFYRRGGAEVHFLELGRLLESHGHEVIHFSAQDPANEPSPYSRYFINNIDLRGRHNLLAKLKIAGHILYSTEAVAQLEALIKKTKPEIAHLHNIYRHLSPSILPVLKKYQIPAVMTLHDYKLICPNYQLFTQGKICERCQRHKYYQAVSHRCIFDQYLPSALAALEMSFHKLWGVYEKNIDVFISPSQFLKDKMQEWGIKNRMEVLPNFVTPCFYDIASDPAEAGERSNPVDEWDRFASLAISSYDGAKQSRSYLLYVGRLSEEKGLLTLLRAMEQLPEINLRIVGDGPLKEQLNNLTISARGGSALGGKQCNNVTIVGYKKGTELVEEIKKSRAVIMPSEWYENYPLSVLEAMQSGKPVIASNIGGLPEIVRDGQSGLLFKAGDPIDLAEKIKIIWSEAGLAEKLGQQARHQVISENDPEKYYERLMEIYQGLIRV